MRKSIEGVSQIVRLGAVWPVNGKAFGPSLPAGSDGATLIVWSCSKPSDFGREERRAIVLLSPDNGPRFGPLRRFIEADGWTVTELRSRADDVASRQVIMDGFPTDVELRDQRCASTGVLLTKWQDHDPGRVFGVWLDTHHGLLSAAIGENEVQYEEWLHT